MSIDSSVYGEAPAGEHFAVLSSAVTHKYPVGLRFVVGFLIVDPETKVPIEDSDGNPQFAVAVCNLVQGGGGNAKSKQFKIRKAMLRADEFDPIGNATSVPSWDHFTLKLSDGSWRILKIRVAVRGENGKSVSLVTHIQQPRDGQWACIEGTYDGPPYPWINADGTLKKLTDEQLRALPKPQQKIYDFWSISPNKTKPWFDSEGHFVGLNPGGEAKLDSNQRAEYDVARIKHDLASRRRLKAA